MNKGMVDLQSNKLMNEIFTSNETEDSFKFSQNRIYRPLVVEPVWHEFSNTKQQQTEIPHWCISCFTFFTLISGNIIGIIIFLFLVIFLDL